MPLLEKWDCKPQTLVYQPYTKEQLVQIVQHRLKGITESNSILNPVALNLCAAKVTAVSGDVRQALDLCRRTIELSQTDSRPQPAIMFSLFEYILAYFIADVFMTYRSFLGSDTVCRIQNLPLHQKLLLISLYREDAIGRAVSFGKVCSISRGVAKLA